MIIPSQNVVDTLRLGTKRRGEELAAASRRQGQVWGQPQFICIPQVHLKFPCLDAALEALAQILHVNLHLPEPDSRNKPAVL